MVPETPETIVVFSVLRTNLINTEKVENGYETAKITEIEERW